jgi:hypothetical protein
MRSGIPFPSQTGHNYRGALGPASTRHWNSQALVSFLWVRGIPEKGQWSLKLFHVFVQIHKSLHSLCLQSDNACSLEK